MMPFINTRSNSPTCRATLFVAGMLAAAIGFESRVAAQGLDDLQTPEEPLVLKDRGSFFVGGKTVDQTSVELGSFGPDDRITVGQMYVEYMIPDKAANLPVVMVHGATLSGKSYDTTPDGRMGWFEYFVRQSYPVYVVDQVGRARSGFNQAVFNNVHEGLTPADEQRRIFRLGDQFGAWTNFRFGPEPGEAHPDTQFPVDAVDELSRQSIPDLNVWSPTPNPTSDALASLAGQLEGAVLVSHSQSGPFPLDAALADPQGIRGAVLLEPGTCKSDSYSDTQIEALAEVPVLVVFGDYLDNPTGVPGPTWQERFDNCQSFISRLNAANGNAEMLYPPEEGIDGNSHMIMQDKNNLQIADLVMDWIDETVGDERGQ
ncbi:alpha/beta hydrolase family protein [Fodinicurvata halophila]